MNIITSEKKTFSCLDQRFEDVRKAIAVLQPVVALIKTLDSKEKERDPMSEVINNAVSDLSALEGASSSISSKSMKIDIDVIYKKYNSRLKEAKSHLESHDIQLAELECEISEYFAYTTSFEYLGNEEIAAELLQQAVNKEASKEEFFAIMLLLLNDSVTDKENIYRIAGKFADEIEDPFKAHILKKMDELDQNEICRMIRESK